MKIEVRTLTGRALNYAVALAEGYVLADVPPDARGANAGQALVPPDLPGMVERREWTWPNLGQVGDMLLNWSGGPDGDRIIDREGIATRRHSNGTWYAMMSAHLGDSEGAGWSEFSARHGERYAVESYAVHKRRVRFSGATRREAAMRCFVASRVDVTETFIDLPDSLCA